MRREYLPLWAKFVVNELGPLYRSARRSGEIHPSVTLDVATAYGAQVFFMLYPAARA